MVCIPCLIVPALLVLGQFLYNRFAFIQAMVHYFCPWIAQEKAAAEERAKKAQADFFASDKEKEKAKEDEGTEGAKRKDVNGSSSSKKKQSSSDSTDGEDEGTKKER